MNLYHCMIELKSDAKALAFAASVEQWMGELKALNLIGGWRLMRRKLGLASTMHEAFLLEIEVEDLAALERAFQAVAGLDETEMRHYELMHGMIASYTVGVYRPFPDPERRERVALI
ncbi:hypothetical protein C8J27_106163 [Rhodobacter aestuarii]|uniref:Uncharacterized protein n=1 Tax=Rhodobacter aestuarii TaxID=453582 RepID=A0A1N7M753_9RHOB|nr:MULTISPECIES: DUF6614 family protein [Rhodobacter]PTV94895.1 hypothetical protein C8J27_106163 [Rhodobacter aestuarii]SIS81956.1 hypothetical protein SAMN05421580_105163 [Rhodobacter aestuarii]SOC13904.1 hypothetical protein SAMN05877809_10736 [Rhodobacter sp. JA431]